MLLLMIGLIFPAHIFKNTYTLVPTFGAIFPCPELTLITFWYRVSVLV